MKTRLKQVDVTPIERVLFVWYMKHLLKAKKLFKSQVACSGAVR